MKFRKAVMTVAVGVLTAALIGCGGNGTAGEDGETEEVIGQADTENDLLSESGDAEQQENALPGDEENDEMGEYVFDHGIQYGYATDEYVGMEEKSPYFPSWVPTFMDGVDLTGSVEWVSQFSASRRSNAFRMENNTDPSCNLNFFEINGSEFKLPMLDFMLPIDCSIGVYGHDTFTSYFRGEAYGEVNEDLMVIFGNKIYFQSYPESNVLYAVSIDTRDYTESESDIRGSIAGISLGMVESDVVSMYGDGTPSNQFYTMEMAERDGITHFQDTVYKNETGILVVTYDDNRCVSRITLFSYSLNQYRDPGIIPVGAYFLQEDSDDYWIFYEDEEGGFSRKGEPGRGTYTYDSETGTFTLEYNGEQLYEGGHHLIYEASPSAGYTLVITRVEDVTTGEITEGTNITYVRE